MKIEKMDSVCSIVVHGRPTCREHICIHVDLHTSKSVHDSSILVFQKIIVLHRIIQVKLV
jgi:hypothetical protein